MQLGMIGLGRMGANIVRRLMRDDHSCVVYDRDPAPGKALAAEGARAAGSLRLEPRLSRKLRLSVGTAAGLVLREMPFEPLSGASDRLRGLWLSFDLGVVFTPG